MSLATGDKIYVPSASFPAAGRDNLAGGLATVVKVTSGKENVPAIVMVAEHRGRVYEYDWLMDNQEAWAKEYAGQIARPAPDLSPESNLPFGGW
jgi:hypothetical protein